MCVSVFLKTVISAIARVFELFDDDDSIPTFGYGGYPERPVAERYFSFVEGQGCELDEVLQRYFAIASTMELNASASFVPVIYEAIKMARKSGRYHILIIVSDGYIDDPAMARRAIVEASEYPLCTLIPKVLSFINVIGCWYDQICVLFFVAIVMIGVGDGPWTLMSEFDDGLPERRFDNFQFVNYNTIPKGVLDNPDGGFAMQALMEIPGMLSFLHRVEEVVVLTCCRLGFSTEQYNQIRKLGLLKK